MRNYELLFFDTILESDKDLSNKFYQTKKISKNLTIENFEIKNNQDAEKYNRQVGNYFLMTINNCIDLKQELREQYILYLSKIIGKFLDLKKNTNVLVVGLGNDDIVADSLGTNICNKIIVPSLYNGFDNKPNLFCVSPGVYGKTGIETFDIIEGIAKNIKADYIIAVDSLCASAVNRLGVSIQVNNGGISPGAGIGNKRKILSQKSLGINVISIGVPLVIYAKTFVEKVLNENLKSNIIKQETYDKIINKISFNDEIVCSKDIDEVVIGLSNIISSAINLAILGVKSI